MTETPQSIEPLTFTPILMEKVWGGRRLERLGKKLPPEAKVGESWEIVDLASTSPSGGGGGSAHSIIDSGAMQGRTIREVMQAWGDQFMGRISTAPEDGFPLLIKFLDAREDLSVQVHPSPEYARSHTDAHLKTEAWYVVEAEPGAVIYKGVKPGVTTERFRAHIEDGTVVEDLIAVPVKNGDCHNLPSGTVHALGAGVLVAEVQTPSDTTFRVFDWGRAGRELHIEQALACIDFETPTPMKPARGEGAGLTELVRTEFFVIRELRSRQGDMHTLESDGAPAVLMCIEGSARLRSTDGSWRLHHLHPGNTTLAPAGLGPATLEADDAAIVLDIRFPQ